MPYGKDTCASGFFLQTMMKLNSPDKNKERLLKQRLYKQEYRKKKKAIADNSPSILSSTDFIHRSTKVRSIEKALPKSPSKHKTDVRSLA